MLVTWSGVGSFLNLDKKEGDLTRHLR